MIDVLIEKVRVVESQGCAGRKRVIEGGKYGGLAGISRPYDAVEIAFNPPGQGFDTTKVPNFDMPDSQELVSIESLTVQEG